jgi:hypothetical protein
MKGFLSCDGTADDLDRTLRRLTAEFGIDSVTLFGAAATAGHPSESFILHAVDRPLRCGQGIDRLENPDYLLFQRIAEDSSGAINVYFTDGVQSASSVATPSPSIRALERWVAGKRPLTILAFRGAFAGEAWSEEKGAWVGNVQAPDRPFYAFVLARSAGQMNAFLQRIPKPLLQQAVTIRFDPDAVRCDAEVIGSRYRSVSGIPWMQLDPQSGSRVLERSDVVAHYDCALADTYPLATVLARPSISYRPWLGTDFVDHVGDAPAGTELTTDSLRTERTSGGRRSTAFVRARFPADPAHRFGFYTIALSGEPGAFRPEVDSLSTDSDADPTNVSRTYLFSWLVGRLVHAQFERDPQVRTVFITLQFR